MHSLLPIDFWRHLINIDHVEDAKLKEFLKMLLDCLSNTSDSSSVMPLSSLEGILHEGEIGKESLSKCLPDCDSVYLSKTMESCILKDLLRECQQSNDKMQEEINDLKLFCNREFYRSSSSSSSSPLHPSSSSSSSSSSSAKDRDATNNNKRVKLLLSLPSDPNRDDNFTTTTCPITQELYESLSRENVELKSQLSILRVASQNNNSATANTSSSFTKPLLKKVEDLVSNYSKAESAYVSEVHKLSSALAECRYRAQTSQMQVDGLSTENDLLKQRITFLEKCITNTNTYSNNNTQQQYNSNNHSRSRTTSSHSGHPSNDMSRGDDSNHPKLVSQIIQLEHQLSTEVKKEFINGTTNKQTNQQSTGKQATKPPLYYYYYVE